MRLFILPMLLCFAILTSTVAETNDSIQLTDTNLITLCASKSDVVAQVKVLSMAFVRKPQKPAEPTVVDLSVYGELLTLEVQRVYLQESDAPSFPTNICLYKRGTLSVSFLEPTLQVGRQYLVFLHRDKAPEIVSEGVVTDPPLPVTNYFTFVRLPQRQTPNRKAYVEIADTNALASIERCFSEFKAIRQKARGTGRH
jgi:hypothetical protein